MTERSKSRENTEAGTESGTEGKQLSQMEAEIDQTRNAISGDLRTLGERLSPEHLKESAKEVVAEAKNAAVETLHEAREAAGHALRDAKDNAVETVSAKVHEIREDVRRAERETLGFMRDNAVPLACIGIGVTWFLVQRRSREDKWNRTYRWGAAGEAARGYPGDWSDWESSRFSDARDRARDSSQRAGDRAQRWVESAEHMAQDAASRVRGFARREMEDARHLARDAEHRVSEAATRARDFAGRELRHARDFAEHASETHPFAVGAAALAAGIGVGLALPQTRRESELLGPPRERLANEAKEIMNDWTQTASDTARDVKDSLTGTGARI